MNASAFQRANLLDRRRFLRLSGSTALLGLAGCATNQVPHSFVQESVSGLSTEGGFGPGAAPDISYYASMYAARPNERFSLPAIPVERIDPIYFRQLVDDPTGERPGTVVVDTAHHFLYLIRENGKAMRYGVGLGRAGFEWAGRGVIQYKRAWPRWTPPDEMVARQPELEPYSIANGGMDPGLTNPLGARALYIFQNGKDTLYRIHGSPEWWTIGKSVSSGCVRMFNQDVIDLYERVPNGTPILVTSLGSTTPDLLG
ncbi:L,D-transpeptidase [Chelativorans intermedius]|uniref:L,D-transpeptidase n=1 Tax=Chelativorans intermedius TaxID=515947 RepID=A0ABV6DBY6_9HYPH|nr:L,D-transpeptidase [Chelativorans intermedius]MCT9000344.1 L,D-transpeptidase [Chelativorans intermedius]